MLGRTRLGGVNVHPYLYAYKGASPVKRAVADKNLKASVGVHWMTSQVDQGEVIVERFVNLASAESETEVYNQLYPQYALVIAEALERIGGM
jgi:methionyl-tRNA formyltransferase